MASIYIETTIVSYLRERQASYAVAVARQILTKRWWSDERRKYTLVTSQYVIDEACLGDSVLAQERLLHLDDLPLLAVDPEILVLADALMSSAALPRKAEADALHIAVAAWHGVEYLLTWNCTHPANARTLPIIQRVLRDWDAVAPNNLYSREFAVARWLRDHSHEVFSVYEEARGTADDDILDMAYSEHWILITNDDDWKQLHFLMAAGRDPDRLIAASRQMVGPRFRLSHPTNSTTCS